MGRPHFQAVIVLSPGVLHMPQYAAVTPLTRPGDSMYLNHYTTFPMAAARWFGYSRRSGRLRIPIYYCLGQDRYT